jgi:hypothetical protein
MCFNYSCVDCGYEYETFDERDNHYVPYGRCGDCLEAIEYLEWEQWMKDRGYYDNWRLKHEERLNNWWFKLTSAKVTETSNLLFIQQMFSN